MSLCCRRGELRGSKCVDSESNLLKTLTEIVSVNPHMVFLPEAPRPCVLAQHRRILVGNRGRIFLWNSEQRFPAGAKDAVQLAHRGAVVGNMLENVAGDDDIESVVLDGLHGAHVKTQVAVVTIQIGGDVAARGTAYAVTQLLFRSEMQNVLAGEKQSLIPAGMRREPVEERRNHAVPNQAVTDRTKGPRMPEVVDETLSPPVTNVTFDFVAAQRSKKLRLLAPCRPVIAKSANAASQFPGNKPLHAGKKTFPGKGVNPILLRPARTP